MTMVCDEWDLTVYKTLKRGQNKCCDVIANHSEIKVKFSSKSRSVHLHFVALKKRLHNDNGNTESFLELLLNFNRSSR